MDSFKTITLTPLTGIFDARSSADQQVDGAFAWKQNFEISPDGKLRTASGFQKPYAINPFIQNIDGVPCPYKNWDWHDQDKPKEDIEPPTLLFSSTANNGVRRLFLGTKTRFLRLDEAAGEWTELGNGFGLDDSEFKTSTRFHAAELQDKIFLTNGFDKVQYHDLTTDTMQPVTSLDTAGNGGSAITAAKVIIQWQGVIMVMNLVEAGVRQSSRIWWSDLNDGTKFGVANDSISDYQDLEYGERILNAIPLLGNIYIFTDRSIWRCSFSIDSVNFEATLTCQRIYNEPKSQHKCLAYPNTLVSDGFSLYYAARDAIYKFNPYLAEPERTEWIYKSSSIIFDDGPVTIDKGSCNSAIAEYRPDAKEIHFSWPNYDVELVNPNVFGNVYQGGGSCDVPPPAVSSGLNRHTLVINTQFNTCDYRDYGCTALVNFTADTQKTGDCNQKIMFMGALSTDFCLKEIGVGNSREVYDFDSESYSTVGYYPILRGAFPFGKFDAEKIIKAFTIDGYVTNAGNVFKLRIGSSFQQMPINENQGNCGILWNNLAARPIKCLYQKPAGSYVTANVRPNNDHQFNFYYRGKFLYYELTVAKANGSSPTSGPVTLTRFEVKAIQA